MMDILEIQKRINSIYAEKFKDYKGGDGLSIPHVPRISEEYLKNRVIILGQETNTWYQQSDDDLFHIFLKNLYDIDSICLTERYDKFVTENVKDYGGKFWLFNRLLYSNKILTGDIVANGRLSHCWMNLFVVEACKFENKNDGRPTNNKILAKKIMMMQGDLVFQVFRVLEPKLIISLTGYRLDGFLFENALGLNESERESLVIDPYIMTKEMLAEIVVTKKDHPLFNCRIIRCYHPTYFMGYINSNKSLKEKIKYQGQEISNSNYYETKLMEKLKSFF